jgi:hypothetical protein
MWQWSGRAARATRSQADFPLLVLTLDLTWIEDLEGNCTRTIVTASDRGVLGAGAGLKQTYAERVFIGWHGLVPGKASVVEKSS